MDLISMILRDSGIIIKDDYSNIDLIPWIRQDLKIQLKEMNGLRNHISHRYNSVDELLALTRISEYILEDPSILEDIKQWIKKL